ncbi:MAG TPA: Gx transporter family protein [Clostridia bacterium]|nr:Gx transporter family protein [Clostridia bacterium]
MNGNGSADINITSKRTRTLVLTGLLFAVAIVVALLEGMLPPIPVPVPGVKVGLSNIVVMYTVFFLGAKQAYGISVLKALFVLITRGAIAGALSLAGGVLSITVMLIVIGFSKNKASYAMTSISGAISHNIGQFIVISLIYTGTNMWFYLPLLVIAGVITGLLTAGILKVILPAVNKLVK